MKHCDTWLHDTHFDSKNITVIYPKATPFVQSFLTKLNISLKYYANLWQWYKSMPFNHNFYANLWQCYNSMPFVHIMILCTVTYNAIIPPLVFCKSRCNIIQSHFQFRTKLNTINNIFTSICDSDIILFCLYIWYITPWHATP